MHLSERLLEERGRLGKSQQQMAEACGVQKRAYIYYEKGERQPDAAALQSLLAAGVDVMYLLTGVRADLNQSNRQAVAAADAVAMVIELLDEMQLQGKLDVAQIKILAHWIVEQRATKEEARAFISGGQAVTQTSKAPRTRTAKKSH